MWKKLFRPYGWGWLTATPGDLGAAVVAWGVLEWWGWVAAIVTIVVLATLMVIVEERRDHEDHSV